MSSERVYSQYWHERKEIGVTWDGLINEKSFQRLISEKKSEVVRLEQLDDGPGPRSRRISWRLNRYEGAVVNTRCPLR